MTVWFNITALESALGTLGHTVKTVRIFNTWSNSEFYMVAEH